jgi:hypothetical protein
MVYQKLTLILRNNPDSYDEFDGGTYNVDYNNASYYLTSDHMVITLHKEDSVVGEIIPIKSIKNFKANGSNPKD